jgi:hypothetical protein
MLSRIKGLLERNGLLLKCYNKTKFFLYSLSKKEPIVIYQMGKVGSTSILRSLRRIDLKRPVFHVHTLNEDELKNMKKRYDSRKIALGHNYYAGQLIKELIFRKNYNEKWKFITLVREPIARNISAFFQNIDLYINWSLKKGEFEEKEVIELIERFLNNFQHEFPLHWFDIEIQKNLGIDVYKKPFPIEKGYQIYSTDTVDLLLMRCEDINKHAIYALSDLLGLNEFEMRSANIGSQKEYKETYAQFKKMITLPVEYVEHMYSSQLVKHFYSSGEIQVLREKWLTKN